MMAVPESSSHRRAEPWFIQTDACYDADGSSITAGVGAVLFNPAGKPVYYLLRAGCQMRWYPYSTHPANGLRFSNVNSSLCFAFSCFGDDHVTDAVVIYTDNNGVRDSLISCVSRNVAAKKILVATMALECTKQITPWYARVPTDSNLSD